ILLLPSFPLPTPPPSLPNLLRDLPPHLTSLPPLNNVEFQGSRREYRLDIFPKVLSRRRDSVSGRGTQVNRNLPRQLQCRQGFPCKVFDNGAPVFLHPLGLAAVVVDCRCEGCRQR